MPQNSKTNFFDRLQTLTEAYLTRRNRIKRIKKEKQRAKNVVLDWLEAFFWAAGMVLLINQYLVQAYQIPSGSMIDTLNIGDHIFVNKLVYGPELLPGLWKMPSPFTPKRNDIVIFENPSYISRGPVFDIAQRIIYMLTLSLVDIDRDESGDPKPHFLIKRAVGMAGDRFTMKDGEMRICFAGEDRWVDEREFNSGRLWGHHISRLMKAEDYPALEAAGHASAFSDMGLPLSGEQRAAAGAVSSIRYPDYYAYRGAWLETLRSAVPQDKRYANTYARWKLGWYVPAGRLLPLGDNRDNSRDGREFGPVKVSKVLGKGTVIYWPLGRAGIIR
jgi:signal peptidase I